MKAANRGPLRRILRRAETLTMRMFLARRFRAAVATGRYSTSLLDEARAWGLTAKA